MKHLSAAFLLLVIFFSSCRKEQLKNERPDLSDRPITAGTRPLPAGDPNLNPNWDWTQQSWTVYFNNANGTIGTVNTLNPFIDGSQKIYGSTNIANADMYPAGGWMLVARDFGTPTAAPAYPFVILYNKYRGTVRVCILRTYDVLSAYQQISLSWAANPSYPDLFKYASPVKTLAYEAPPAWVNTYNTDFKQTAVTQAGVQEWMVADFDARGYSGSIDNNLAFNVSMAEIAQSDVVLNGSLQLDGTIQPKANDDADPNKARAISAILTILGGVGGSTGTDVSGTGGSAAGVLGIVKQFLSFFSAPKSGPVYQIGLTGSVTQKGTITLKSPKTSFSVYLKPVSGVLAYRALQTIPWGVLNTNAWPIISDTFSPLLGWQYDPNTGDYSEVTEGYSRSVTFSPFFITQALVINPAISSEVASIEVATITNSDDPNTYSVSAFVPLGQYEQELNNRPYWKNNFGNPRGWNCFMAFGIKLTFNNGAVVYQVLPF